MNLIMNLHDMFARFQLEKITLNAGIAKAEISFKSSDNDAAWELYVEMLTRIITQRLPSESGDEQSALDSVYTLFSTTREILCRHGRNAIEFSKVAVPILNQIVRPFTTKWHRESLAGAFDNEKKCQEFRTELEKLLNDLSKYNRMLAEIAGVEDLTGLELVGDIR